VSGRPLSRRNWKEAQEQIEIHGCGLEKTIGLPGFDPPGMTLGPMTGSFVHNFTGFVTQSISAIYYSFSLFACRAISPKRSIS